MCLSPPPPGGISQAEANASIVHSVAPFGNRHITQLSGAFELLRPNVKDILYTLEVRNMGRNWCCYWYCYNFLLLRPSLTPLAAWVKMQHHSLLFSWMISIASIAAVVTGGSTVVLIVFQG